METGIIGIRELRADEVRRIVRDELDMRAQRERDLREMRCASGEPQRGQMIVLMLRKSEAIELQERLRSLDDLGQLTGLAAILDRLGKLI